MKLSKLLLALFANLLFFSLQAQEIEKTTKVKLETEQPDYKIFSLNEHGLLLGHYPEILGTGYELKYTRYDQNLKELKTFKLKLGKKETVGLSKYFGDKYFYFAVGKDLNKTRSKGWGAAFKEFTLYRLDIDRMDVKTVNFKTETAVHIRDLVFRNDILFIHGQAKESVADFDKVLYLSLISCFVPMIIHKYVAHPFIFEVDFNKKTNNKNEYFMNNFGKTSTDYYSFEFRDTTDNINLLLASWTKKSSRTFYQKIENKKAQKEVELTFPDKMTAVNGRIFNMNESKDLVAGIYGETKKVNPLTVIDKKYSGIYISKIENEKLSFLTATKFQDFNQFNFFPKYFNKNKEFTTYIQDLIEKDGKYYVLGESYFQNWKVVITTHYDRNGGRYTSEGLAPDGLVWIGGFVICYDHNGKLLWENGLNLTDKIVVYNNNTKIKFNESEDGGFELRYEFPDKTQIKTIDLNGKASKDQFIDAQNEVNKVTKDNKKTVVLAQNELVWFDDNKLAYEFKQERNKKIIGKKFDLFLTLKKIKFDNE